MRRGLRTAILTAVLIVAAAAPAGANYVAGCANPADSALNQYCETVPAAGGPQLPKPGTPALAQTLPTTTARAIASTAGSSPQTRARRALLRVPAAQPGVAVVAIPKASSSSGFPLWLILLLVALALALGATVVARRRRRRSPPPVSGAASA